MAHQLETLLSDVDLHPYLDWTNGNRRLACEFHELNFRVGQAIQPSLQGLELALAGRIHDVLSEEFGKNWLEDGNLPLMPVQRRQVVEIKRWLVSLEEDPAPDRMMSALPFGFWVSFFSPEHGHLWDATLHRILQANEDPRPGPGDLARRLATIVAFRERILRPQATIIHLDLNELHADIVRLTRSLSPDLADLHESLSRFPTADFERQLARAKRLSGRRAQ